MTQSPITEKLVVGQILEAAPDAMVVVDAHGLITVVNSQTENVFGYTREELFGQPIGILMPERFRAGHEPHRTAYQASPRLRAMGSGLDLLARRKDGSEFPVDIMLSPLDTEDGPMVVSVIRDLTVRKQAEEKLRDSERRLTILFNASPAAICVNTVETGRIIDANERFAAFIGFARGELVGRTVFDLQLWADPEARAPVMARLKAERSLRNVEARFRRKHGDVRDVLVSCELVELPGENGPATISMFVDITDRRQAEAALHQLNAQLEQRVAARTAELEEANKELDVFAHSVSHDLRAPLRAISGFGQFLDEEGALAHDGRGRGHLRRMMEAATRMSTLIDDLLEFAQASRAELRRQPVDLSALAQAVAGELQEAEPGRRVQFLCPPGLTASGDSRLLRVVLTNLLGNAWKYTGKVTEPRVELGLSGADGDAAFFIRDNGAGFDMEYAHRLFGAFQRLHLMSEFKGTGVGLATVQRILHRHGGRIWAEAKVNEGATFYFTLPAVSPVSPA